MYVGILSLGMQILCRKHNLSIHRLPAHKTRSLSTLGTPHGFTPHIIFYMLMKVLFITPPGRQHQAPTGEEERQRGSVHRKNE